MPDGVVTATHLAGDTLYIGGNFFTVGRGTGGGVVCDPRSGAPNDVVSRVDGSVYAAIPDGHGGWFIGGSFYSVSGVRRTDLAHILRDGSVDSWDPEPNREIVRMALDDDVLYVSGLFATIGGQARQYVAALDIRSGRVLPWNPSPDGLVLALAPTDQGILVGGRFSQMGGAPRFNLGLVNRTDGTALPWTVPVRGSVYALLPVRGTVFVGGDFTAVGDSQRVALAALDQHDGQILAWNAHIAGPGLPYVLALDVHERALFVGGAFSSLSGSARRNAAAVAVDNGTVLPWDAALDGDDVETLLVRGDLVYLGGYFFQSHGMNRMYAAAVDARSGRLSAWNPRLNNYVATLAFQRDAVFLGGPFTSCWDWESRHNVAAIDVTTSRLLSWSPNPDGAVVYAMTGRGSDIYIAGDFTTIAGVPRTGLAAIDKQSGRAESWDAHIEQGGFVRALAIWDDKIYFGGRFGSVSGVNRTNVAAVRLSDAILTPWNPNPNGQIGALAASDAGVYLGGTFDKVAEHDQPAIGLVDPVNGRLDPSWKLRPNGYVEAITLGEGAIYLGGTFTRVNGLQRFCLAAANPSTGALLDWAPSVGKTDRNADVATLAYSEGTVYAGGSFASVADEARNNVVALSSATASVLPWSPGVNGRVFTITPGRETVWVGGAFYDAGGVFAQNLVGFPAVMVQQRQPLAAALSGPRGVSVKIESPSRSGFHCELYLPMVSKVTCDVFDVSGRCMASIVRDRVFGPGLHRFDASTAAWSQGMYYCQLSIGGQRYSSKVAVIH